MGQYSVLLVWFGVIVTCGVKTSAATEDLSTKTLTDPLVTDEALTTLSDTTWTECTKKSFTYECTANYGLLKFDDLTGEQDVVFKVDGTTDDVEVMVLLAREDLRLLSKYCTLTLGEVTLTKTPSSASTTVYITSGDTITLDKDEKANNCTATLKYVLVAPLYRRESIDAASSSGYIEFPSSAENDTMLQLGYAPQNRVQWTLTGPMDAVWTLTVESLNLGARQQALHGSATKYNSSQDDFLLLGAGTELLEADEVVLFGRQTNKNPQVVRINNHICHVVLYSSYHENYAAGFRIKYETGNVTQASTTLAPPTTPPVPESPLPTIWAEINGVRQHANDYNYTSLTSAFQESVAKMATAYGNDPDSDIELSTPVNSSEVEVQEIGSCVGKECDPDCVAFHFGVTRSVVKEAEEGAGDEEDEEEEEEEVLLEWAFSEEALQDMVQDEEMQQYWAEIGEGCEYCQEAAVHWWVVGVSAAAVVVVGVAASLAVCKVARASSASSASSRLAAVRAEEEKDMKRRSSSILSKIGGPKRVHHTSHPFSDAESRGASMDSAIPEMMDASEYSDFDDEYEDDLDYYNRDPLPAAIATTSHTNAAFVPDQR